MRKPGAGIDQIHQKTIDLLQRSTQRVDFIISDFNMPVMDGAEFVQKVRVLPDYRFIKVLMLTGNVNDQTKEQAKKGRYFYLDDQAL